MDWRLPSLMLKGGWPTPSGSGMLVSSNSGRPLVLAGLDESLHRVGRAGSIEGEGALHVERAVVAVERAVREVLVRFQPLQHRQHLLPRPVRVAGRHPVVHVGPHGPGRGHDVHRRAAAHDAAGELVADAAVEVARAGVHRQVVGLQQQAHLVLGFRHHLGNGLGVRPGLQQQHLAPGVFGEAAGRGAARRASADDDDVVVVGHEVCPFVVRCRAGGFEAARLQEPVPREGIRRRGGFQIHPCSFGIGS